MALVGRDRFDAVGGFGDDVQVGLLVDDVGDAGAQQRVVVDERARWPERMRASRPRRASRRPHAARRQGSGMAKDGGSQASTTSVPDRGAVTIVSDAPIRSARSCMLVMPKPVSRRSLAMPRPSSATDSRKPTARTPSAWIVMRRARAWRTALVSASCAMPMISALDAVAERRQLVDDELDRHVGVAPRDLGQALERRGRCLRHGRACGRSAPTERRASTRCVRARSTAVSMLRATGGGSVPPRAAPLQLHQDRGKSLRELVVDIARQAIALFEHRLPAIFRAGSDRRAGSGAARASPGGPSPRSARRCHARLAARRVAARQRIHPRLRAGSTSGATMTDSIRFAALNARTCSGRRASSPSYSHDLGPAGLDKRTGVPTCSRSGAPASPIRGCLRVKNRSSTMPSTDRSRRRLVVEQPDAAGVTLALFDERLDEDAEEPRDVRLAHQEIDGELDRVRWMRAMHSARRRSLISFASASAHASAVAVRISSPETDAALSAYSQVPSNGPRS